MNKINNLTNLSFNQSKTDNYSWKASNINDKNTLEIIPSDCFNLKSKKNGFYEIKPHFSRRKIVIYCDFYLKNSIGVHLANFSNIHLNLREPRIFKTPNDFLK